MKRASRTSHVANVPATAPVARRHIVQWQFVTRRGGPSASKRTAPHKQEPGTFVDASLKLPSSLRSGCLDERVPLYRCVGDVLVDSAFGQTPGQTHIGVSRTRLNGE